MPLSITDRYQLLFRIQSELREWTEKLEKVARESRKTSINFSYSLSSREYPQEDLIITLETSTTAIKDGRFTDFQKTVPFPWKYVMDSTEGSSFNMHFKLEGELPLTEKELVLIETNRALNAWYRLLNKVVTEQEELITELLKNNPRRNLDKLSKEGKKLDWLKKVKRSYMDHYGVSERPWDEPINHMLRGSFISELTNEFIWGWNDFSSVMQSVPSHGRLNRIVDAFLIYNIANWLDHPLNAKSK